MKIAIHSDLHLEGQRLPDNFLTDDRYDVLILAGDIVSTRTFDRLSDIRMRTDKPILYVLGNHEFYHGSPKYTKKHAKEVCKSLNISLLDRNTVDFGKYRFLGCTGWSDLQAYRMQEDMNMLKRINDFRLIKGWTPERMVENAGWDKRFIRKAIKGSYMDGKLPILITHFPISKTMQNMRFDLTYVSNYFVNNWLYDGTLSWVNSEFIKYPLVAISGHTHGPLNCIRHDMGVIEEGGTLVTLLSNQRGYGFENDGYYNPNFVFDLDKMDLVV